MIELVGAAVIEDVVLVGAADPSRYRLSKFAAQHSADLVDAPKKVRDIIRHEVRKAVGNGEGPTGIADRLYGEIDKTPEEIDRIAKTEYTIVRTGAKLEQMDAEAGDDADAGKAWVVGKDGCDVCQQLADNGPVPLGEPFVTDDGEEFDGPPAHPWCDCDVEEADLAVSRQRAAVTLVGAWSPEQPRDAKGQWTSGLYHGTTAEHAKTILKEGLKPGMGGTVFLTTDAKSAEDYGHSWDNHEAVVLKVTPPKESRASFGKGPMHAIDKVVMYQGHIPPEWITVHKRTHRD